MLMISELLVRHLNGMYLLTTISPNHLDLHTHDSSHAVRLNDFKIISLTYMRSWKNLIPCMVTLMKECL